MAKDTWALIGERITALAALNERQDATAALLRWDDNPYKLVRPDKTELRDAISVTPNLPKVFAHGVIADLLSGKWQTVVEGDITDRQKHQVETFADDGLAQADEFILTEHGISSLFGWLCNHVCIRWSIGARLVSQIKDGQYLIDCLPVDMRWTPFVLRKWVAPITFLSKGDLEQELEKYEKAAKEGNGEYTKITPSKDTGNETRDYWDAEKNEFWVEKELVYTQKNSLGYPPFVIVTPASGFMLRDEGYLKHEGPDILFLNAGLYTELARTISLEQTSGYAGLYPAYEYETRNMDSKPARPPPGLDQTDKVAEGERHIPVPRGDINRAGQTARVDIQDMISVGGPLSPRQYNTPPSAILLAGETEMISRLQNARKDALGIFRSQLVRMMIEQFIQANKGGAEILIGQKGRKVKHSATKLGNPENYTVTYHLSVKSKRQELANLAEFAAVYDKLPLEWTLPNILMADDPAGIINNLNLRKAKSINPALDFLEMGLSFLTEAESMEDGIEREIKEEQAKIMAHEYVMAMRARIQPVPMPSGRQIGEPKGDTRMLTGLAAEAMRGEAGQPKRQEVIE